MGKFVVAGVTQIETIVKVDKIPVEFAPLTRGTGTICTSVGGDAYNESLALKWLGNDVTFMSMVGRTQNMELLNPADRKVTIPTEYIIPQMENTPTEVIFYDRNRRQQIFEDPKDLHDAVYDLSMATPLVAACDMVILANANFCRPFLRLAREHCRRIAVNVRNFNRDMEKYNTEFLNGAQILYFSDDILTEDPFDFVQSIADRYATDIIVLGQGAEGVILYDRNVGIKVHYNSVNTNEVVNTAGAGNALFSCFLHYYLETGNSVNAIKNALLFASYKIGYMGTSNGFMTTQQLEQWHNLIWGVKEETKQ